MLVNSVIVVFLGISVYFYLIKKKVKLDLFVY